MSVPPLPKIEGDAHIILDIYTHSSLRSHLGSIEFTNREYGDADRLALLGKEVLDLSITYHWYKKSLSAEQIRAKQIESLSENRLMEIVQGYSLAHKLRYAPGVTVDAQMCKTFLDTYVGALFIRNGLNAVQSFVSELIDPGAQVNADAEMIDTVLFNPVQQPRPPSQPLLPVQPPPPAPPGYTQSVSYVASPPSNIVSLAIFNQIATQRGYAITWTAESSGPPHQPIWTVRCCLNGTEKGRGTGKSQKVAKEEAARQAWATMGGFGASMSSRLAKG